MKALGVGVYEDTDGTVHVEVPELLRHFGWPDTPENREWAARVAADALRDHFPSASVFIEPPESVS